MTAAAMATTATVEAARITRHSFPGDPLVKTYEHRAVSLARVPRPLEFLLVAFSPARDSSALRPLCGGSRCSRFRSSPSFRFCGSGKA
jgi:hypothetical protein